MTAVPEPSLTADEVKRYLGSLVRWLLLFILVALRSHNLVGGKVLGFVVNLTAEDCGSLSILGWSVIQKWNTNRKIKVANLKTKVALALPAGSDETDINTVITTSPGTVPTPAAAAAILGVKPPNTRDS
jgi:hypothetical protein